MDALSHTLQSRINSHCLTLDDVAELGTALLDQYADDGCDLTLRASGVAAALSHETGNGTRVATFIDALDTYLPPPQSGIACHARPGSEERIAEYAARFERGDAIFCDDDTGVPLWQEEDARGCIVDCLDAAGSAAV